MFSIFKPLLLALVCFSGDAPGTTPSDGYDLWHLVAQANLIVVGTLDVPIDSIQTKVSSGEHDYVKIGLTVDQVIKGSQPKTAAISWDTEKDWYSPTPESIIEAHGKKVIVFLDVNNEDIFFAGYSPSALANLDSDFVKHVRQEVNEQRDVLQRIEEIFPSRNDRMVAEVKSLIDATTQKETQAAAFSRLEALGRNAVPAIIMLMDDRRALAIKEISLKNPPVTGRVIDCTPRKLSWMRWLQF